MRKNGRRPHVTRGNVLNDLGFEPEASFELKVKSELHSAILKLIRKRGYTPQDLEKLLEIQQPRVSELMNGKLHLLSLNKLAAYADLLGGDAKVKVSLVEKNVA